MKTLEDYGISAEPKKDLTDKNSLKVLQLSQILLNQLEEAFIRHQEGVSAFNNLPNTLKEKSIGERLSDKLKKLQKKYNPEIYDKKLYCGDAAAIVKSGDMSQWGGKTYKLAEQYVSGLNVPKVAGIGKDAFYDLTRNLGPEASKFLSYVSTDEYVEYNQSENYLGRVSDHLQEFIISQEFSPEVEAALYKQYMDMGGDDVLHCLRSSASDEDKNIADIAEGSLGQSFAGQQLSLINVRGWENFKMAIKRCMASAYSFPALSYRIERGINIFESYLPVTHQLSGQPDFSIYGFSENKDDGERMRVVNMAIGYGASIADGEVNAARYSLNLNVRDNLNDYDIEDVQISEDKTSIYATHKQTTQRVLYKQYTHRSQEFKTVINPDSQGDGDNSLIKIKTDERFNLYLLPEIEDRINSSLDEMQARQGGVPQDVELGYRYNLAGKDPIYIFQTRDITTNTEEEAFNIKKPEIPEDQIVCGGEGTSKRISFGKLKFVRSAAEARAFKNNGENVIVLTGFAGVDHANAFQRSKGAICLRGSYTAHASVVGRENRKGVITSVEYDQQAFKAHADKIIEECLKNRTLKIGKLSISFDELIAKNISCDKESFLKNYWVDLIADFLGLVEGEEYTIDGALNSGKIYKGKQKALLEWQKAYDASRKNPLKDGKTLKSFEFAANAGDEEAAIINAQSGIINNSLLRAEVVMGQKGVDPTSVKTKQEKSDFISDYADRIFNIAKHSTGSVTYRGFGPALEERDLEGSELMREGRLENKLGLMQGVRYHLDYSEAAGLEFEALKLVVQKLKVGGYSTKLKLMAQFARTTDEISQWLDLVNEYKVSECGIEIGTMFETAGVLLNSIDDLELLKAKGLKFISIGTNDLLGSAVMADRQEDGAREAYPMNSPYFIKMLKDIIIKCKNMGLNVSLCGDILTAHPEVAVYLVKWGLTSGHTGNDPDNINRIFYALQEAEKNINSDGKIVQMQPRLKVDVSALAA